MTQKPMTAFVVASIALFITPSVHADLASNSTEGINSISVPYTGAGISIGQVEPERPGKFGFDDGSNSNFGTIPVDVFLLDTQNGTLTPTADAQQEIFVLDDPDGDIYSHSTQVAGVMISTDGYAPGVAQGADLYASASVYPQLNPMFSDADSFGITAQFIAGQDNSDVRAVNISVLYPFEAGGFLDGNSKITQFVDWSAKQQEVLYVSGGRNSDTPTLTGQPLDNYNGITVGASERPNEFESFRKFSSVNGSILPDGNGRTHIDILAPGVGLNVAAAGGGQPDGMAQGTSLAAPHVTGTVALLQEHGDKRIMEHAVNPSNAPKWGGVVNSIPSAHRHQVMKAVLMNSADKLHDNNTVMHNGSLIPQGNLLGMERTVVKSDGTSNWLNSDAFMELDLDGDLVPDTDTPLDEELGTGHLNAKRALQQFIPGEQDVNGNFGTPIDGDVPLIGWDYGTIDNSARQINKYVLDTPLVAGNFISITLAWDREVEFANDQNTDGDFDIGDTFQDYASLDDVLTNLDLYLVTAGTNDVGDGDIAISESTAFPVEHIFTEIPFDGEYEIWVFKNEIASPAQDYGIAWWYGLAPDLPAVNPIGDFDADGDVDAADLAQWQGDFGINGDSDADNDGDTDGADFLAWQRNFGATSLSVSMAVPEPNCLLLLALGLPMLLSRRGKV